MKLQVASSKITAKLDQFSRSWDNQPVVANLSPAQSWWQPPLGGTLAEYDNFEHKLTCKFTEALCELDNTIDNKIICIQDELRKEIGKKEKKSERRKVVKLLRRTGR